MLSFEELPNAMKENGEVVAETTAQYEYLDAMTKIIMADLAPIEGSEASKEREVRKTAKYKEHIELLRDARKEMLKAKAFQEALNARFAWYQSVNANKRAEMNLL